MMRLRCRLRRLGPAVAAFFALWIVTPRKALLYHTHHGGEHQHVHAEGDDAWLTALFDELQNRHHHDHADHHHHHAHHDHGHHHRRSPAFGTGDHHGPVVRAGGDTAGHWHQPHPVYRAVVSGAPHVVVTTPLETLVARRPPHDPRLAALELHARGPPASVLFS